ncbi:acyl-CoA dehydrogenase family protein [Microbacterium sp. XT11]|uniref:acyl-CoA dehydrogenase family protein n=1 Tax=Microbacterium sp. XT11 TaxID=367477 RepID=UPI0009FA8A27|nr:acyl-CoA dehydrogenase family protein [Microbacterium sp. XT11]
MSTHTVTNQAPPRVDRDEYGENVALRDAVEREAAGWAVEALHEVGRRVGSAEFQDDARRANRHEPVLHTHDRWGNRIDEVEYDPAYHRVIAAAVADGAHTGAFAHPRPGASAARAAVFMLYAQVEPGHACPVSMTHAAVPVIAEHPSLSDVWLPRLLSRDYDPDLRAQKHSALFGMAMTEKQGGSDVRANTTVAVPVGDGRYELTGHKWFCSAPMSDAFLVLAQAPGGLSCFLVPRVRDDGTRNALRFQRLKDKLGNRSNASSEVEYEAASATLVGEEGRGVRAIIDMVTRTRLDSMLGSLAGMRQGVAEAAWHVRHRAAFGRMLVDQPAMTGVIADLQLEVEAGTAVAMRLARAYDDDATAQDVAFRRLATAVMKYWVCKRGPAHAAEALECLGGNGITTDWPLELRYREQPVMAIWEGSGNVIALDVLRALTREPASFEAFDAEVAPARGAHPVFDAHLERTRRLAKEVAADPLPDAAARRLVEALALSLSAAQLLKTAPSAVAEGFVSARLDGMSGVFGALPRDVDAPAIAARA